MVAERFNMETVGYPGKLDYQWLYEVFLCNFLRKTIDKNGYKDQPSKLDRGIL